MGAGDNEVVDESPCPLHVTSWRCPSASGVGGPGVSTISGLSIGSLGDDRIRDLASRYGDAIERGDADMLVSMLTEDAVWAMPPIPSFYRGRVAITEFLIGDVFPEHWRHRATRANGQLAVGCYLFDADKRRFVAAVLDVLTLDGDWIAEVDGFLTSDQVGDPGHDGHFVGSEIFPRFGLPAELPELSS
jgi:RNA polymerase sigma-70 factor (ECF subfamily)